MKTRVTGFASENIGTMLTGFLPTIYAIVAPPETNVPLIVGSSRSASPSSWRLRRTRRARRSGSM